MYNYINIMYAYCSLHRTQNETYLDHTPRCFQRSFGPAGRHKGGAGVFLQTVYGTFLKLLECAARFKNAFFPSIRIHQELTSGPVLQKK